MKHIKYIIMLVCANVLLGFFVTDPQDYFMTKYIFSNKIFLQMISILISYLNVMYIYHFIIEYAYVELLSKVRIGKRIYSIYFGWIIISAIIYLIINLLMDILMLPISHVYIVYILVNIAMLIVFSFSSLLIKKIDISIFVTFLLYISFRIFLFFIIS